ncbi:MAG: FAD-dependent oxidoreductase [Planctomycetes bacterium]|nr:FAD-dependent oxidoreductase [Planctomycetota bacterium]
MTVAILGGGCTGLATAVELLRRGVPVVVLEAAPAAGGLAATFERDGFAFDFGPHELPADDPELRAWLLRLRGVALREHAKRVAQWFRGRLVPYPFGPGDVLRGIGLRPALRALAEVALLRARGAAARPAASFRAWVEARFGATLEREFFGPYTRKVWGRDPALLDARTAAARIPVHSLLALARHVLRPGARAAALPRGGHAELGAGFLHPRGGIGALHRALEAEVVALGGVIRRGARVTALEVAEGRAGTVHCADGTRVARLRHVVATIPLDALVGVVRPADAAALLARHPLEWRGIAFVFLRAARRPVLPWHWVYAGDPGVAFQRVTEFSGFAPEMAPAGRSALACEVSCEPGDGVWEAADGDLVARCVAGLERLGVHTRPALLGADVVRQRHAYPVQTIGYAERAAALLREVAAVRNLTPLGRQGLFRYCNLDECVAMARAVAPAIAAGRLDVAYGGAARWRGVGLAAGGAASSATPT